MVLRAGFWATKTTLSNKVTITKNTPYLIGPNGHWFVDDRIGFNLQDDPTGRIWVDRARTVELKRDADGKQWVATIGDDRLLQDPAQRAWQRIEGMVASLRDIGVWSVAVLLLSAAGLAHALTGISDSPTGTAHTFAAGSDVSGLPNRMIGGP